MRKISNVYVGKQFIKSGKYNINIKNKNWYIYKIKDVYMYFNGKGNVCKEKIYQYYKQYRILNGKMSLYSLLNSISKQYKNYGGYQVLRNSNKLV